jgi:transposase
MSTKSYRPWAPEQPFLLPPSPRDWLEPDHLAWFVLEVVTEVIDITPFTDVIQAKDPRGNRPYSPYMMVALLVYAYCTGVFSSRRIERATYDSVAFRVLAGGQHPDHASIARFRRTHINAFEAVFEQVVKLCREMGMLKLGRFALDGSKIKADASRHKAMSYEHMNKVESRLREEISQLLERAEQTDQDEDARYGDSGCSDLPEELRRREDRLKRIVDAKATLERRAREARAEELDAQADRHKANAADSSRSDSDRRRSDTLASKRRARAAELRDADATESDAGDDGDEDGVDDSAMQTSPPTAALPSHRVRHTADGEPHPKAQRNFTDPDSQIMEHKGAFIQAYNVQSLNDESGVIVAQAVTNVAPDTHHLPALVDRATAVLDSVPGIVLADTGYWAPENAAHCDDKGIEVYIATGRKPVESNASATEGSAASGADPPSPKAQMTTKLRTPEGEMLYRARKWIAEPPFGNIKEIQGFRQFSLRGMELVRGEWSLVALAHNIRKAWLFRKAGA